MRNGIDVSVIVPVYNVEEYLEECLDSLLNQGDVNLEVIMIDDGSTDSSGEIADQYVNHYDNFHCYHIENGGLGHARNYAVQYAKGKYIIFLDSDDVVPDFTYEKMFLLAEKHSAEMTICNVERFDSKGRKPSFLHRKAFHSYEEVSHITHNHDLLNDTTSWNKLINKEFYEKNNFSFPENILYEDIPVTIPLHYMCNKVAMIKEMGYLWRIRDGGSKSITQQTSSMKNLDDRLTILRMLDEFFDKNVKDESLRLDKEYKHLDTDLKIFVNMCASIPEEDAYEMLDKINAYIDEAVSEEAFEKLSILDKQRYSHVRAKDLEGLIRFLGYKDYNKEAVIEEGNKHLIVLPEDIFTVPDRDVSKELIRGTPGVFIDDLSVDDEKIEIIGHVYLQRLNLKPGEQTVRVFISNYSQRVELKTEAFICSELTKNKGNLSSPYTGNESSYNYDGAGFKFKIDIDELVSLLKEDGLYHLDVEYENKFYKGISILGGINKNKKEKMNNALIFKNNASARLIINRSNEINIDFKKNTTFIDNVEINSDELHLNTSCDAEKIIAVPTNDGDSIEFQSSGGNTFKLNCDNIVGGKEYLLFAENLNKREPVLANNNTPRVATDDRNVIVAFNQTRIPTLTLTKSFTQIEELKTVGKTARLKMKRRTSGDQGTAKNVRLVMENKYTENMQLLGKTEDIAITGKDLVYNVEIALTRPEIERELYQGTREIFAEYEMKDGSLERESILCDTNISHIVKAKELRAEVFTGEGSKLLLKADYVWPKDQASAGNRKILINKEYKRYNKKPLVKNRILFESMWGSKYSCNPRAIYEYIDEHYPGYECIWSLDDPRIPIKGNAKRIRRGSLEYYYYLATSKYLVNNVNFPDQYEKRSEQIEVQTMHGTPLKTFGLDIPGENQTQLEVDKFIRRNSRWNYLVAQGRFVEEMSNKMFGVSPEVLRTGYPRTDELQQVDEKKINELKEKLGLPTNKKVILYAPTWRVRDRFDMNLDLEAMRKNLSDEYVLLIRIHYFSAAGYEIPEDREFIYDLNKYSSIEDLYLVSDIMITDYSSSMFDYALLNKPMVFFTYDMEEYCEKLRGLYVDFEKEAPGPICMTSEEVINAIRNINDETEKCKDRINSFKDKFLTYEQPYSTKTLVEEVFDTGKLTQSKYLIKKAFRDKIYNNGKRVAKRVLRPVLKKSKKRR